MARRGICGLLIALLLCSPAFALEVPVSQTEQVIDGKQTLTKIYEVDPSVDPETLKGEGLELNGYTYALSSFTKEIYTREDTKTVSEEMTIPLQTTKEDETFMEALKMLPQFIEYEEDGYSGKLILVASTIDISETGRSTHPGSSKVTKTYTVDYNDDSLIPSTVTEDGRTYSRASITWSEGQFSENATIPDNYTATVVYSRSYSYTTVDGYQATATYTGDVELLEDEMIRYTVQYIGSPIVDEQPSSMAGNVVMWGVILAAVAAMATAAYLLLFKKKGLEDLVEPETGTESSTATEPNQSEEDGSNLNETKEAH